MKPVKELVQLISSILVSGLWTPPSSDTLQELLLQLPPVAVFSPPHLSL